MKLVLNTCYPLVNPKNKANMVQRKKNDFFYTKTSFSFSPEKRRLIKPLLFSFDRGNRDPATYRFHWNRIILPESANPAITQNPGCYTQMTWREKKKPLG